MQMYAKGSFSQLLLPSSWGRDLDAETGTRPLQDGALSRVVARALRVLDRELPVQRKSSARCFAKVLCQNTARGDEVHMTNPKVLLHAFCNGHVCTMQPCRFRRLPKAGNGSATCYSSLPKTVLTVERIHYQT